MPSFEDRFYLANPGRLQALRRDARLLLALALAAWGWLVAGRRLRRALKQARERGTPAIIEDLLP